MFGRSEPAAQYEPLSEVAACVAAATGQSLLVLKETRESLDITQASFRKLTDGIAWMRAKIRDSCHAILRRVAVV